VTRRADHYGGGLTIISRSPRSADRRVTAGHPPGPGAVIVSTAAGMWDQRSSMWDQRSSMWDQRTSTTTARGGPRSGPQGIPHPGRRCRHRGGPGPAGPLGHPGHGNAAHLDRPQAAGAQPAARLAARVGDLARTRSRMVVAADAERRRIERDLHDGAQARLVSLAMELGRAKARFADDPEAAKILIDQAHDEAKPPLPSCATWSGASTRRCSPTGGSTPLCPASPPSARSRSRSP
jgi:hypothetical protein